MKRQFTRISVALAALMILLPSPSRSQTWQDTLQYANVSGIGISLAGYVGDSLNNAMVERQIRSHLNREKPQRKTVSLQSVGTVFMVTTTSDTGNGSLRKALTDANTNPGLDMVSFNISPAGPQTITPLSKLPNIIDPVIIDGTTQPGFVDKPMIEINCSSIGSFQALDIYAGGSTVRGLVINRLVGSAGGAAIVLWTNGGNVIEGNFIGTDITGTIRIGNRYNGIVVFSRNNRIGGTAPGARNVLSGNGYPALHLGAGAGGDLVQGNFIGTDVTGTVPLGNSQNGIVVVNGAANDTIGGIIPGARNVISASGLTYVQIAIAGPSGGVQVLGNTIGTDVNGTTSFPNQSSGILIFNSANNVIGGTTAGARNIISGNRFNGVSLSGASGNKVQGNFIGVNASGTDTLGNGRAGIRLFDSPRNIIGGNTTGAGNVVAGNHSYGVEIVGNGSTENKIQGNFIGTEASETIALGNGSYGIFISASQDTIGGQISSQGNVIAYNDSGGVFVQSGTRNLIRRNRILNNNGLGIDLTPAGVTPNDHLDGDTGANNLQNSPMIESITVASGSTTIRGRFHSVPNQNYTLDFFLNRYPNGSRYSEGDSLLAGATVFTDPAGNALFNLTVPIVIPSNRFVSATATDSQGNTSEFSQLLPKLAFFHHIPDIPEFAVPLEIGSADGSRIPKICADASDATLITVKGPDAAYLRLRIAQDPNGTDQENYGNLPLFTPVGNDSAYLYYRHPTTVQPDSFLRNLTFELFDPSYATTLLERRIQIYRPPVVLIHGLWSNAVASFGPLASSLLLIHPALVENVDYQGGNYVSFSRNDWVIPFAITSRLSYIRQLGFSARKVDAVGHSMGGLLARRYLKSPTYRDDIRRLITINTPHWGSQSANLLLDPFAWADDETYELVKILMEYTNHPLEGGAVDDLCVGSQAIADINDYNLNAHPVPTHAIVTTFDRTSAVDYTWFTLFLGPALAGESIIVQAFFGPCYRTAPTVLNQLYQNESNDVIVPFSSQVGGVSQHSLISGQHHSSTDNPQVIQRIIDLLRASPNHPLFSTAGFQPPPPTFQYSFPRCLTSTRESTASGTIVITNPPSGTTVQAGQSVSVTVVGGGEVSGTFFYAGNNKVGLYSESQDTPSGTYTYQVPVEAVGPLYVIAIGQGSTKLLAMDSTYLNVNVSAALDSITPAPSQLTMPIGLQRSVALLGSYSDGIKRILSNLSGVQLQSANSSIARIVNGNLVEGVATGVTTVTISYLGRSTQIPVRVVAASAWQQLPGISQLVSPTNDSTVYRSNIQFTWRSAAATDYYQLQISSGEDFTTIIYEQTRISGLTVAVDSLMADTVYHWRVRGLNFSGPGAWSDSWRFRTNNSPPTGVKENPQSLPLDFAIYQSYPNPFNPSTTVRYDVPVAMHVSLKVYNVFGQEVATLVNEKKSAGRHQVEWNAAGVASGVYFYRIQTSDYVATKKLILLR